MRRRRRPLGLCGAAISYQEGLGKILQSLDFRNLTKRGISTKRSQNGTDRTAEIIVLEDYRTVGGGVVYGGVCAVLR